VAGKEIESGTWVRPVGKSSEAELSARERRYPDGREPQLLDIFDLGLNEARPGPHQPENWVLAPSVTWQRMGELSVSELEPYADHPASLWTNGSSSGNGVNDQVPEHTQVGQSLYLIYLSNLSLYVHDSWRGGTTVRADLRYAGADYRLVVTDPVVEKDYQGRLGEHDLGPAYVTVSLAEALHGNCYKLVAGVIRTSGDA
jgi:hypothetical protein